MDTEDALLFVRVAETLSFKDAAAQLGFSRSVASKRIALLEKQLGVILINRNSRNLSLTPPGAIVLEQCRKICGAITDLQQLIHGHGMQPVGALQAAIPTPLAATLLPMLMAEFVPNYPKLDLSMHVVDGEIDVVSSGFDVALVVASRLKDSGLTAQKLAAARQVVVASPNYLSRHGTPRDAKDMLRHRCLDIGYARTKTASWRFRHDDRFVDVEVPLAMTTNSYLVLNLAACLDMGMIYAPEFYVSTEIELGKLQVVLREYTAETEYGLYAVYAARRAPEKVRAFIDFVRARIDNLDRRNRETVAARSQAS